MVNRLRGVVGLKNLGNTCYLNSVMQCLAKNPCLQKYLGRSDDDVFVAERNDEPSNVIMQALFRLCAGVDQCLNLQDVLDSIRVLDPTYQGHQQHDAHELLTCVLNHLNDTVFLAPTPQDATYPNSVSRSSIYLVERLFHFNSLVIRTCLNCHEKLFVIENLTGLSIAVCEDSGDVCNLKQCLDNHFTPQTVIEDYKCPIRGCRSVASEKIQIEDPPPTLCIHLKRFLITNFVNFTFRKITCLVHFPLSLDILDSNGNVVEYNLSGVIYHHGESPNRGHYTSACKQNNRWFNFNDESVQEIDASAVVTSDAYILMYCQKLNYLDALPDHLVTECQGSSNKPAACETLPLSRHKELPIKIPCTSSLLNVKLKTKCEGSSDIRMGDDELYPKPQILHHGKVGHNKISQNDDTGYPESLLCCPVMSDIEAIDPILTEEDIPGAKLDMENLPLATVPQLKFWLACRGLVVNGRKADLIQRIIRHDKCRKSHIIDPKVGGGKYYEEKKSLLRNSVSEKHAPLLPILGWKSFPSHDIPIEFNYNKVFHYLVESSPRIFSLNDEDSKWLIVDEEDFVDSLSLNHSNNSFARGEQFLRSGHVNNIMDCRKENHYFVKAEVQASMKIQVHTVTVTISLLSGSVCEGTCNQCKQSALGRCSHVSAVLLAILKHIDEDGYEALSSTGRQCTWGRGSKHRNPGAISKKTYSSPVNVQRRASFDPRPKCVQQAQPNEKDLMNDFIQKLSVTNEQTLWYLSLKHEYCDYEETENDLALIGQQCNIYFRFLNEVKFDSEHPHEIEGTFGQTSNQFWKSQRCTRVTASECKRILGLSTPSSRMKFLKMHMWGLDTVQTWAMTYGQRNEKHARYDYQKEMQTVNDQLKVVEVGIMINPNFPGLSCSPDGLVITNSSEALEVMNPIILQPYTEDEPYMGVKCMGNGHILCHKTDVRLLEIKCPLTLKDVDPNDFNTYLTPMQLQRFILRRDEKQNLVVKEHHKWYYQIQMSLDILGLMWCDLVIWSPKGKLVVPIQYDPKFWEPKREALIKIHRQMFIPDLFSMRTPRSLCPLLLDYKEWHEDVYDTYFYEITLE